MIDGDRQEKKVIADTGKKKTNIDREPFQIMSRTNLRTKGEDNR
jgi:hypothetical protein